MTTPSQKATNKGNMTVDTAFGAFDIILDPSVPKDTFYAVNTSNWYKNDTYKATVKCINRLKTAWRALVKGEVLLTWQVPSNKKDKRLHVTGKKEGWL